MTKEEIENYPRKSHKTEEIIEALKKGLPVFEIDTNVSGNDDILIMAHGETEDDVKEELKFHFELDKWPNNWTINEIELTD